MQKRLDFLFLNIGHFYDHFLFLIFETAAALVLSHEWHLSYADLIPYATPGFIAFGLCAIPAGWIADKWSRKGMMVVFFIGIGGAAILTALAETPVGIGFGLLAIGIFAAIYHPVGIALVVETHERTGVALAVNGVFGNLGVASAALVTALFIDSLGWRWAFALPGIVSIATGIAYCLYLKFIPSVPGVQHKKPQAAGADITRQSVARIFLIVLATTAIGGLIFQAVTFALPKILDERLDGLASSATEVGWYTFLVFAVASLAQLLTGNLIDRQSARTVFIVVAAAQAILFWVMQSLTGPLALIVAASFTFVMFGQIPITDVLVGRLAQGPWRSRIFATKYVVSFLVSATAVPLIALIHRDWGFDILFATLAVCAAAVLAFVLLLPASSPVVLGGRAPEPAE
jgi:MFS family permease